MRLGRRQRKLVQEIGGGEPYEYYPPGEYVASAPGACDGEPTFKYTRINVEHALDLLSGGWTVEQVAQAHTVPSDAVREVLRPAKQALISQTG